MIWYERGEPSGSRSVEQGFALRRGESIGSPSPEQRFPLRRKTRVEMEGHLQ